MAGPVQRRAGAIAVATAAPTSEFVTTVGEFEMRKSFMNAPKLLRPFMAAEAAGDGIDSLLMQDR
jgi:hypothetical protein